ncbi:MAG: CPBP family intramembrane metalloprotease [Desulfobacteraceae bacterium]|nr:CPBP family intramembrane metalloprotease [Desulfobacteraceae bacterium]
MTKKAGNKIKKLYNRDLLLPYGLPYFAYVGIVSLGQDRLPVEVIYILEIMIVPLLLYWAWKWYAPIKGPEKVTGSIFYGIVFGILGLVVWCLLLAPFIDIKGEPWDKTGFFLRLFTAAIIVPVFEELFIRGYIFRLALQWDNNRKNKNIASPLNESLDHNSINDVKPGAWSVMAIAISTIAFSAGHMPVEWVAAVAYSILMSILWMIRKDLLSCIVAHGVTNLTLGLYVWYTGNWGFW